MKQKLILILFLSCTFSFVQAELIQGTKGKFTLLTDAPNGIPAHMSANVKYIGGTRGQYGGYLYEIEKDSFSFFDNVRIVGVSNDKKMVGNHYEATTKKSAGVVFRDGQWRFLQNAPETENLGTEQRTNVYGISADGNTIVGYVAKYINTTKAFLGTVWQDTIFQKLLYPYWPMPEDPEEAAGYSARPSGVSPDGKVIYGFGSWNVANEMRCTNVWIGDSTYFIGSESDKRGEAFGSNSDGSVVVGTIEDQAFVWSKEKGYLKIPAKVGWYRANMIGISKAGLAFGYFEDRFYNNRVPFVWSEKMGVVLFKDYLKELYGLDVKDYDLNTAMEISDDGKTFVGLTEYGAARYTYLIQLDSNPINTRPSASIFVKQVRDMMTVNIQWSAPIYNGREVLGYNIYCDDKKINTDLVSELTYAHTTATKGVRTYKVTAVYANGESDFSPEGKVQVVEPGGCYSVKYIHSELEYNRTHRFHWGLPVSEIEEEAVMSGNNKNYAFQKKESSSDEAEVSLNINMSALQSTDSVSNRLDFIKMKSTTNPDINSLVRVGDFYYGGKWNMAGLIKYNLNMEMVETIMIPELPSIRAFALVGNTLFGISGGKYIYEIDLENRTIGDLIPIGLDARHFAYIPTLDDGKGGFEIGDWNTSTFISMDGTKISDGLEGVKNASGGAYHKGYVYMLQQTGESLNQIIQYDVNTRKATGLMTDVGQFPEVKALGKGTTYGGGISLDMLEDSTLALLSVTFVNEADSKVVFLELESMPRLLGFNIYRDGLKVNGETPLSKRNYTDILFDAGTYAYTITSKYANGCESDHSDTFSVEILPIEGCNAVTDIKAVEQNKNVILTYEAPAPNTQSSLLGLNIYRNGERINDALYLSKKYTDLNVPVGKYTYRIEAYYDNSCFASDSIALEVTHLGICMPVQNLKLKAVENQLNNKTKDILAQWELPNFENPVPLRWGDGSSAGGLAIEGLEIVTVAFLWDTNQLKMYKDFVVVGIEFIIRDVAEVRPVVFINEQKVYEMDLGRPAYDEYVTAMFDSAIPISNAWELMVGMTVDHAKGKMPLSADLGPAVHQYGDWFSPDMITWYTAKNSLKLDANWSIAALVAKKRDVNGNSELSEPIRMSKGISPSVKQFAQKEMQVERQLTSTLLQAPTESITLQGFNIYRDNVKLNTENPITNTSYLDQGLAEGGYTYKVSSIWNTCDELYSDSKYIKLSFVDIEGDKTNLVYAYPNPISAQNTLYIQGEYKSLEIYDVYGRKVSAYLNYTSNVDVKGFKAGMYMFRFTLPNGKVKMQKVLVE